VTVVALIALAAALRRGRLGAVTKLLANDGVGSARVVDGSLLKADLSKKAVAAPEGVRRVIGAVSSPLLLPSFGSSP